VSEAVLDASVVAKWFRSDGERHVAQARSVRSEYESGTLVVLAPALLHLELLNVAARRWRWSGTALAELATALDQLGFELLEPELEGVARWAARGLTAYDAAYVALAEANRVQLVTDDDLIVSVARELAVSLEAL
jgi:predicted nucleic acid-binding protein